MTEIDRQNVVDELEPMLHDTDEPVHRQTTDIWLTGHALPDDRSITISRPTILANFIGLDGRIIREEIVRGWSYRNPRYAFDALPRLFKDSLMYQGIVRAGISELFKSPQRAYKVMLYVRKSWTYKDDTPLRSIYLPEMPYRLGRVYAHPIYPAWGIGLRAYQTKDAAQQHAATLRKRKGGAYAIVEVETSKQFVISQDGGIIVVALRPVSIIEPSQ